MAHGAAAWNWPDFLKFVVWAPAGLPTEERHALANARLGLVNGVVMVGTNLANIPITVAYSNQYNADMAQPNMTSSDLLAAREDQGYAWSYGALSATSVLGVSQLLSVYGLLSDLYQKHVDRLNNVLSDTQQIIQDVAQVDNHVQGAQAALNNLIQQERATIVQSVQQERATVVQSVQQERATVVQAVNAATQQVQNSCATLSQDLTAVSRTVQGNQKAISDLHNLAGDIDRSLSGLQKASQEQSEKLQGTVDSQAGLIGELLERLKQLEQRDKALSLELAEGRGLVEKLTAERDAALQSAKLAATILERLGELEAKLPKQ